MCNATTQHPGAMGAPRKLDETHQLEDFDCGQVSLNDFLSERALKNNREKASVTYVVCERDTTKVIGYYALSNGSINRNEAPSRIARNMPPDIPIILLGRLAVDSNWQGSGMGKGLLKDALKRAISASDSIGARALVVHALTEEAAKFYKKLGFVESPVTPMTYMLSLRHDPGLLANLTQ
jgi:predicted N-acetyltransferase YhbS